MLQQPKYREAWRAQTAAALCPRRENVIRLAGFHARTRRTRSSSSRSIASSSWYRPRQPKSDDAKRYGNSSNELYEQDERDDQAKLRELLGEEKHARIAGATWRAAQPASRSTTLRTQLTGARHALRDDQVEPLIAALHAERVADAAGTGGVSR